MNIVPFGVLKTFLQGEATPLTHCMTQKKKSLVRSPGEPIFWSFSLLFNSASSVWQIRRGPAKDKIPLASPFPTNPSKASSPSTDLIVAIELSFNLPEGAAHQEMANSFLLVLPSQFGHILFISEQLDWRNYATAATQDTALFFFGSPPVIPKGF